MENKITVLTEKDKAILQSYHTVAEGTAEFWGENCEVVVHDLSHLDSSVAKIVNGHLSGRHAGAAGCVRGGGRFRTPESCFRRNSPDSGQRR